MSYDEFWNKDYLLIESFKYRHDRELDYHAQLAFQIYAYMNEVIQLKIWSEGDPKKRGKAPNITSSFEPVSERAKYLRKLQSEKEKAMNNYLNSKRGDVSNE